MVIAELEARQPHWLHWAWHMYVCMFVCMYVCMDGWMDGWMDFSICNTCTPHCMFLFLDIFQNGCSHGSVAQDWVSRFIQFTYFANGSTFRSCSFLYKWMDLVACVFLQAIPWVREFITCSQYGSAFPTQLLQTPLRWQEKGGNGTLTTWCQWGVSGALPLPQMTVTS